MKRMAGFSLVEVIIAGALIATSIGTLFALASMSGRLTYQAQERLIASQLARQGLEVVRTLRDANFNLDTCTPETPCPDWAHNIVLGSDSVAEAKGIVEDAQQGYRLTPVHLTPLNRCTDYILRSLSTGEQTVVPSLSENTPPPGQQLFCRRLLVEPVILPGESEVSSDAIRVRSQVAWLGHGRNQLRDLSDFDSFLADDMDQYASYIRCPEGSVATEWCTEQITILTNWRSQ